MRIPLFGTGAASGQKQVTVRKTVGMYWERRGETEKSPMVAVPFPGTESFATLAKSPIRAITAPPTGGVIVVASDSIYRVTNVAAITEIGTIGSSDSGVRPTIACGANGVVVIVADSEMRRWDGSMTTPSLGFTPGTCAWIGGYFVVSASNQFYISTDGSTWTDFASAEAAPDRIIGLLATRNELFIFGESTVEVWTQTGDSDFPFARINGATAAVGTRSDRSLALVGGVPYFFARSSDGMGFIARMNGYTPERVSTDDIDRLLPGYGLSADHTINGVGFTWNGHPMYQVTRAGANPWTRVYDTVTGLWTDVTDAAQHKVTHGCEWQGTVFGGGTSGDPGIYRYSADAHNLPKRQIVTDHVVSPDGERFTVDSLRLDMATNVDAAEKQVSMKVSRDGGLSWGASQSVGLGTTSGPQKKVEFRRLGRARSFTFDLDFPADVPITVHSASLNASD